MKSILITIFSFLFIVSGFGQTRNVVADTNGVVIQPTNIWTANATNARTGLGLGSAATNPASAFQPSSSVLTNLASSNAINLTNIRATNIVGIVALSLGGTGATNAAGSRINLGLGWSALTNSNAATALLGYEVISGDAWVICNFETLNITNTIVAPVIGSPYYSVAEGGQIVFEDGIASANTRANLGFSTNLNTFWTATNAAIARTNLNLGWSALTNSNVATGLFGYTQPAGQEAFVVNPPSPVDTIVFTNGITVNGNFWGTYHVGEDSAITFESSPAPTRTNLGLGWSALTNSNTIGFNSSLYGSNTNPVLVGSNGSVVSPTNFWQVAPIQTIVQNFIPVVNATNNATNARTLYVYSLATNVNGVTNTVVLPTNTATFVGDTATVIHRGTTSSTTAVRISGQSTNVITISNYDDAVKLIHEDGSWSFYHNIGFVEPIRFIDGDIELNQAVSRTNLGMPLTILTNTNKSTFQEALFNTNSIPTNSANVNGIGFNTAVAWMEINIVTNSVTNSFRIPLFK